ncbi:hypothetical protein HY640_01530 [Candidatus Woesearchaeota archaeon]|nr:hypothetical protein [Candidatus Woesearchaeota archaeon]
MQKGQVSLFIIMGLVTLLVLGLAIMVMTGQGKTPLAETGQQQAIELHVQSCIEMTAKDAEEKLNTETFPDSTNSHIELAGLTIPVYYDQGRSLVPTLQNSEERLARHINEELPRCTTFEEFKKQGLTIETQPPSTKVTIGRETILIEVNYPIKASTRTTTYRLNTFVHTIPSGYGNANTVANNIVASMSEDTTTHPSVLSQQQAVIISFQADERTNIYQIIDTGKSYAFATRRGNP